MKRLEARDGWLLRGCVWGMVVALHLVGAALLLELPTADTSPPTWVRTRGLQVRFIEVPTALPPPAIQLPARIRVVGAAPARSALKHMSQNTSSPRATRSDTRTAITWTPAPVVPTYVPGGGILHGDISMDGPNLKLPGSAHVQGAPVLNMIDPRAQGLAGVVRFIGGLTGAVDGHCLDLAAWQAMTPEDRIQNHVNDDDMKHIEENYNCATPHVRAILR